mmetsp:Transcript_29698/g.81614  ORF Transcript_29698/g.81614 Transcript_29698/m.81614 type:complete len:157 (-) Transcript_29698:202-672(-)|eukprot:CAMPEP_0168728518 /NCGR_PEP_ID=MMETSP0724-20121128/5724_1 /TAXON_ID=265536 /ORGANISM="Amphiprora sp., Strain CCMP467" /LENGTH=156 /DNA_ID=CAMNT_0008775363 /DNA_START=81 /DNA_END=551 /DNA_ORIENTATION=+
MKLTTFCITLLFASVRAFSVLPAAPKPLTQLSLMSAEESESLISQATECAEGECAVEDVDDLIQALKDQQKELYDRVEKIKTIVHSLEVINDREDRKVDEVRETVRAIFRVFNLGDKASGNDYPSLSKPTGFSGEVGKGSQTAWDVLPPKKWKPEN